MTAKKINILFTILAPKMGGAERLVYSLIKEINRDIFHPSLAYFQPGTELNDFAELGIPLYYIPIKKRVDFHAMTLFASILETNKIELVNSHLYKPFFYSFYGCKIKNKVKLIYTEHSAWEVYKARKIWKFLGHYLLKNTDKVIGISEKSRDALTSVFNLEKNKAITINNGVPIDNTGQDINTIRLKNEIGVNEEEKLIGIVANFRTVKNHIMLLKSFNLLLKDFNNVSLLLIGQGFTTDPTNREHEIRNYIHEHKLEDKVILLGYRNDVSEILKTLDIFCLTSLKEGLPISLIEAMAAKLPVVGTKVEGIQDIIVDSKNGFLIELNEIEKLKDALLILLNNNELRNRFREESLKIALEKYSLKKCVSKYEQLFYSLVRNGNN